MVGFHLGEGKWRKWRKSPPVPALVIKGSWWGAPGWYSCLSVRLLLSAQVMISGSRDRAPSQAPLSLPRSLLLPLPLRLPLLASVHSHFLSNKEIHLYKEKLVGARASPWQEGAQAVLCWRVTCRLNVAVGRSPLKGQVVPPAGCSPRHRLSHRFGPMGRDLRPLGKDRQT